MLTELAKKTIQQYVKNNKTIEPKLLLEDNSEFLKKKAGTFVTLKKDNKLRACIGTYLPIQENIAQEVISNAIGAATRDHRFGAITEEELPELSYEVQVLSKPEPIEGKEGLNPEKYGIVVKEIPMGQNDVELDQEVKTSVLLPDLEGVDTYQKQLVVALRKAGISNQNKVKVWRFRTHVYS